MCRNTRVILLSVAEAARNAADRPEVGRPAREYDSWATPPDRTDRRRGHGAQHCRCLRERRPPRFRAVAAVIRQDAPTRRVHLPRPRQPAGKRLGEFPAREFPDIGQELVVVGRVQRNLGNRFAGDGQGTDGQQNGSIPPAHRASKRAGNRRARTSPCRTPRLCTALPSYGGPAVVVRRPGLNKRGDTNGAQRSGR